MLFRSSAPRVPVRPWSTPSHCRLHRWHDRSLRAARARATDRQTALVTPLQPWLIIAAGCVAALQVGKLPPALPTLQAQLELSLLQAGFLLSVVQGSGMVLGLMLGQWIDGYGLRRSMFSGLLFLAVGSTMGA